MSEMKEKSGSIRYEKDFFQKNQFPRYSKPIKKARVPLQVLRINTVNMTKSESQF